MAPFFYFTNRVLGGSREESNSIRNKGRTAGLIGGIIGGIAGTILGNKGGVGRDPAQQNISVFDLAKSGLWKTACFAVAVGAGSFVADLGLKVIAHAPKFVHPQAILAGQIVGGLILAGGVLGGGIYAASCLFK